MPSERDKTKGTSEMTPLEQLQAELTMKLGEIDALCRKYRYEATPTLLLRHNSGPSQSILMGNDSLGKVVLCIAELGDTGNSSDMSPSEAVLKLFQG